MSWLAALVRGLIQALLPFLFKKGPTHAEDSMHAPDALRRSWAARINRRLRELESEGGDDPPDYVDDSERGTGAN